MWYPRRLANRPLAAVREKAEVEARRVKVAAKAERERRRVEAVAAKDNLEKEKRQVRFRAPPGARCCFVRGC